jgi:hypothetical protein
MRSRNLFLNLAGGSLMRDFPGRRGAGLESCFLRLGRGLKRRPFQPNFEAAKGKGRDGEEETDA